MESVEELRRRVKELEEQIAEITGAEKTFGIVKLRHNVYPTCRPDDWSICVLTRFIGSEQKRWKSIINSLDKDDAIAQINGVVNNLMELRNHFLNEREGNH